MQGVDGWDVDLPTMFEANLITNAFMKVAWVFVYLGVYGLRPVIIRPKANSKHLQHADVPLLYSMMAASLSRPALGQRTLSFMSIFQLVKCLLLASSAELSSFRMNAVGMQCASSWLALNLPEFLACV